MTIAKPHGGKLVNRIVSEKKRGRIMEEAREMEKLKVDEESIMDVDKIAIGAYSPIEGFLNREDYESVLYEMRLQNGLLWTIPIILAPSGKENEEVVKKLKEGDEIALVYEKPIAILHLEEKFALDKNDFAYRVYGTVDKKHPNVADIFCLGSTILAGKIDLIQRPSLNTFPVKYELTPLETRKIFKDRKWERIVGFQCRNPPHRGHEYIQRCALELVDGLFIHPVVGKLKKGDYKPDVILRAYEAFIKNYYPEDRVLLASLSISMRYAGPKAAIFLAIIRKNYGCTHFILGRDIAGIGDYYEPYAAHRLFDELNLGIEPMKFCEIFYCTRCTSFASSKTCSHNSSFHINISQTEIRRKIKEGEGMKLFFRNY